jgi:hypothetical protein
MHRLFCIALAVSLWISAVPAAAAGPSSRLSEAAVELSRITGLKLRRPVAFATMPREELRGFIEKRIDEEVKPSEIERDELVLKRFGLIPRDFDLKASTIDLLAEQAAAFYDYRSKKLYLMKGSSATADTDMLLVHELAHALADQHFNLGKFLKKGANDDAAMARMAVMEGQATWLMLEYAASKMGRSLRDTPGLMEMMSGTSAQMVQTYPVLSRSPLYIRSSLLFPYTAGMRFQHQLLRELGDDAFRRVFQDPPETTQQVLHPVTYLSSEPPPAAPELGKLPPGRWKEVARVSVGEFDHAVLLEQAAGEAESDALAPQWRGSVLGLDKSESDGAVALRYASEWATPEAAERMFQAYKKVLQGKWRKLQIDSESADSIRGVGDDGPFQVVLSGNTVRSLEGAASPRPVN